MPSLYERRFDPRGGPGPGELGARVQTELGTVTALDISPRMATLTNARGVTAVVGDVEAIPLRDALFDCVIAAWVLYHVEDIDRALAEVRRVLRPDGRLIAVTNCRDHLAEIKAQGRGGVES